MMDITLRVAVVVKFVICRGVIAVPEALVCSGGDQYLLTSQ